MDKANNKHEDLIEIEDSENYKGGQTNTFKEICMAQYRKAVEEGSKQMLSGGVEKRLINGQIMEMPIPNQREIFFNSVEMLRILLTAHISDEEKLMKVNMESFDKDIDGLNKNHEEQLLRLRQWFKDNNNSKQDNTRQYNEQVKSFIDEYELNKVQLNKKLLIELSILLNKKNYFDEQGVTGG